MNAAGSLIRLFTLSAAGIFLYLPGAADEILENACLTVRIVETGGKAVSIYDKSGKRELVNGGGPYGGIGKSRDILVRNIEPLTEKFKLSKPSEDTVEAVAKIAHANLAGMELRRTFRLPQDALMLEISESWKSLERKNSFAVNFHNMFQFTPDTFFYIPSRTGLAETDSKQAKINHLNMISDLGEPWIAALDRKSGLGTALYIRDAQQVESFYHWNNETLEANFHQVTLSPVAASDEWNFSAFLIPFSGKGRVVSVTSYLFDGAEKGDLLFVTRKRKIAIKVPAELKLRKPLTKLPPRRELGTNGFYYYFPELYLSPEIDAGIAFGLRGSFRGRKNFRFAIDLPAGVAITYSRFRILRSRTIVIDGKTYRRHEIVSPRTETYYAALYLNLKLNQDFQENSAAYIQALWDGGKQPPEKIILRQIPKLPEIGRGLTRLSIFLGDSTENPAPPLGDSGMRPVPPWKKIGVTGFEFWDWIVPAFHNGYLGGDFYTERLNAYSGAGLECAIELNEAFSRHPQPTNGRRSGMVTGTLFHPAKRQFQVDRSEFQAVDVNGKAVNYVCPSYRGIYFEKSLDILRTAMAYGFQHVMYDEEHWNGGMLLCHCRRCLEKFGRDPAAYPKEWQEFKTDQVADIYRRFREVIGEKRKMSVWVDIDPAGTNRLTDFRKLARHADYLLPMYYTADSAAVGAFARKASEIIRGERAVILMGLSPNRTYEYYRIPSGNLASPNAETEQILEAVFNGARGVNFWAHRSAFRGALGLYNIAMAVKELIPVEEIIIKGKPLEIPGSNPDVRVTAYEYNGEIAVFARNYERGTVMSTICGRPIVFDKTRTVVMKVKK